jgi:hypothetical protein
MTRIARGPRLGEQLWVLHKGGQTVSLRLTDLENGGFELRVTRSDGVARSVQLFRVRESAMAEVGHQVANYVAHGWAISGDRR